MHNPFGNPGSSAGLMDKMLGTAYQSVKIVADHIDTIKDIAANITAVKDAARNMARKIVTTESVAPALGNIGYVALPDGVAEAEVVDSVVVLVATNGAIFSESSGEFSTKISAGFLEVDLPAGAEATLAGGTIRWTLSYQD